MKINKNLIFFLLAAIFMVMAVSFVFAQEQVLKSLRTEDSFIHPTGIFSIIPPKGYRQTILREDGVQFINILDKSFMSISFSYPGSKMNDEELLERFTDTDFRKSFISNLQLSSQSLHLKVVSTLKRKVADIPAIQFVCEGVNDKGIPLRNDFIIFYKGNKEFMIILGAQKELFSMDLPFFEEALASFKFFNNG